MTNPRHHQAESPDPPVIESDEIFDNDPQRDRKLPKRRLARERVMQMLYARELGGGEIPHLFHELVEHDLAQADARSAEGRHSSVNTAPESELIATTEPGGPESAMPDRSGDGALAFARELVSALTIHGAEIDNLLSGKLERWDISRVALIDRLLIQIGIAELLYFPEIPPKATINELIEVAKDFSTKESGKFINGLLHAVMTHLRESGELNKSGRGLLDEGTNGYSPAKGQRKKEQ